MPLLHARPQAKMVFQGEKEERKRRRECCAGAWGGLNATRVLGVMVAGAGVDMSLASLLPSGSPATAGVQQGETAVNSPGLCGRSGVCATRGFLRRAGEGGRVAGASGDGRKSMMLLLLGDGRRVALPRRSFYSFVRNISINIMSSGNNMRYGIISRGNTCNNSSSSASVTFGRRKRSFMASGRSPVLGCLASSSPTVEFNDELDLAEEEKIQQRQQQQEGEGRKEGQQQRQELDHIALATGSTSTKKAPLFERNKAPPPDGEAPTVALTAVQQGSSAALELEEKEYGPSMWETSSHDWRNARQPNSEALYTFNMELAELAKGAQWEEALTLLRQAQCNFSSGSSTSSNDDGDENHAGEALTRTKSLNEEASTGEGNFVNNALINTGHHEGEEEEGNSKVMVETVAVEPNVVSYNNVITACANAKKQKRAEGIFREMTKEWRLTPNVFTYGALISACAKRGNWEDAIKYLEVNAERRLGRHVYR